MRADPLRLEFCTTAMRRPGIVLETYRSFAANLRGVDFAASTLYLNIDPKPIEGDAGAVVLAAREHFGNVVVNQPEHACFPAALKWCWSQPGGEFLFSLEDDWRLERPVQIADMLAPLRADPGLSCVNIRIYPHNDDRLCLSPGLWRTDHAKAIAAKMRTDANPEMQLRRRSEKNPHGGLHEGYRGFQMPGPRSLRDIGRPWMACNKLRRVGDRHFLTWG
jgi:hypothetical protein